MLKTVKRPDLQMTPGRPTRYPYEEVRQTLNTDRAVVYRRKTRLEATRAVEAMRRTLRNEDLRLGRLYIKDGVLLWVEQGARKDGKA